MALPNIPASPEAAVAPNPEGGAAAEDMVEINIVIPRSQLEEFKGMIGMINEALEGAATKADADITAQKGGGEDPLAGFADELNKAR